MSDGADTASPSEEKARLREVQIRRRAALAAAADTEAAIRARDYLLADPSLSPGQVVSAYWPLVGEFDTREILRALHARGHVCALPVTGPRGSALVFRRWTPETALEIGRFRVATPPATAPEVRPQVLLVPLLAIDRRGLRLGYGGGYYDRTLAALRGDGGPGPVAIGIGFAGQEIVRVPAGPNDIALDGFVSDAGTWRVRVGGSN